jgi:hypothetical protein
MEQRPSTRGLQVGFTGRTVVQGVKWAGNAIEGAGFRLIFRVDAAGKGLGSISKAL